MPLLANSENNKFILLLADIAWSPVLVWVSMPHLSKASVIISSTLGLNATVPDVAINLPYAKNMFANTTVATVYEIAKPLSNKIPSSGIVLSIVVLSVPSVCALKIIVPSSGVPL